jgi:CheY-like chemotaxis protein
MDNKGLILVVDDNADYRELLVWTLERHCFQTISAKGGREALELAIGRQPDLVMMDLNMPGMNGYEATRAIHAHPQGRRIPVVAVSADCADDAFKHWAYKRGFFAFVAKPWEPDTLLEIVMKVFARGLRNTRAA